MDVSTRLEDPRAWVEVNLAHLAENARAVRAAAGGTPLLPMVKADAYGLGALEVVHALEVIEPWGYGVATVTEAMQLRQAGVTQRIVVFTPPLPGQLQRYRAYELTAVLDDPSTAGSWSLPFHLEIDTGMSRCGIRWDDAPALSASATEHLEGAFTHLYAADADTGSVAVQWDRFSRALDRLPRRPPVVHVANSAGAWRLDAQLDLVRPGIFLYGGRAGAGLPAPRPVLTYAAPVVSVRTVDRGDTVSYGADWTAPRQTRIATLGAGYADGIPRSVQGNAHVLLRDVPRPVVGRVTMDFTMIDVGDDTSVTIGDVATVFGSEAETAPSLDQFAQWAGTISYEIIAGLGSRIERRYVP